MSSTIKRKTAENSLIDRAAEAAFVDIFSEVFRQNFVFAVFTGSRKLPGLGRLAASGRGRGGRGGQNLLPVHIPGTSEPVAEIYCRYAALPCAARLLDAAR